ncbi:MAG: ATP-binding protein [Planctomycetota bacterium]
MRKATLARPGQLSTIPHPAVLVTGARAHGAAVKVLAAVQNGLEAGLSREGLEVVAVTDQEGVEDALSCEPAFAVVDESLPFATDLVVRIKAQVDGPDRDRIPVVSVNPGPRQLRCVPDLELPVGTQPRDVSEAAKGIVLRRARQRRLFDQEAHLQVPTTRDDVDRAGDILELLIASAGYEVEDEVKFGTSLREALGNAAEHGNKYQEERTIDIRWFRSADRIAISISDQGPGFDTSAFLARADEVSALEHTRSRRDTEARPGGLGVFIMRQTCDDIRFNQSGNTIFLMKLLPGR